MFTTQLLDDLNRAALIDLFGLPAVMDVEAALSMKNSKPYVQCRVRKKDVQAKREELVRQLWLVRLSGEYYSGPAATRWGAANMVAARIRLGSRDIT